MLTTRKRIYYATGRFGTTIVLNIVFVATFWMYTNQVDLDPVLNGIGNAAGKIVIGISSVIFGYISDTLSSDSKLGRRKFFIWTGAPALAISFLMLFTPQFFIPSGSQTAKFAWLIIWNCIFHLFYGYLLIPYQSWMPEITSEEERVKVSSYMNTSNLVASAIGSGFILLMSGFIKEDPQGIYGKSGKYLIIFAVIFAVIEVLMFLPALLSIKEKKVVNHKSNMWSEIKVALRNRNYMIWVAGFTFLNVGVTLMTALMLDFLEEILGIVSALQKFLFAVLSFVVLVSSFVLWGKLAKKYGKKWSLILAFTWLLVWLPLTPIVGKIPLIPPVIQGYVYGIGALMGISAVYLFPYAIMADFADKDEKDTSQNRSGVYTGFKSLPFNVAQALGFIAAGFLRGWTITTGFVSDELIKEGSLHSWTNVNLGLTWLGPLVATFLLFTIPITWFGDFDPFMDNDKVKKTSIFKQIFSKNK